MTDIALDDNASLVINGGAITIDTRSPGATAITVATSQLVSQQTLQLPFAQLILLPEQRWHHSASKSLVNGPTVLQI